MLRLAVAVKAHLLLLPLLGVAMLLGGCSRADLLDKFAPDDKKALAIEILENLRKGTGEETYALLDESQKTEQAMQVLAYLAQGIPDEDYTDLVFVNYEWKWSRGERIDHFTFEYNFEGRFFQADISLKTVEDSVTISGLHVGDSAESIVETSKFTFEDLTFAKVAFLVGIVALPAFSILTLVVCIASRNIKRKWLWCVFILLGVTTFTMNWSTGEWVWSPYSIQLLSASFESVGAYGAWMFGLSIPLGAIVFWARRMTRTPPPEENCATPDESTPPPALNT